VYAPPLPLFALLQGLINAFANAPVSSNPFIHSLNHFGFATDMQAFDQLRHLEAFLSEERQSGKKMSELYEIVQYAGNILPRLYAHPLSPLLPSPLLRPCLLSSSSSHLSPSLSRRCSCE
jgi:hypothetical protein